MVVAVVQWATFTLIIGRGALVVTTHVVHFDAVFSVNVDAKSSYMG